MDTIELLSLVVNLILIYVFFNISYFVFNATVYARIVSRADCAKFIQKRLVKGYDVQEHFRNQNALFPGIIIFIGLAVFAGYFMLGDQVFQSYFLSLPFALLIPLSFVFGIVAPLDGVATILPDVLFPHNIILPGTSLRQRMGTGNAFRFAYMSLFWINGGISAAFSQWMRRIYTMLLFPRYFRSLIELASARTIEDAEEYPALKF